MFALCKAMKWNHLPVRGGIYDQDPVLMDQFMTLFGLEAEKAKKDQEEQERKSKNTSKR